MTKVQIIEELKKLDVEMTESMEKMKKEELEEILKEAKSKVDQKEGETESVDSETSDAPAEKPVFTSSLVETKGRFSLFTAKDGFQIMNERCQLISFHTKLDEATKTLSDLAR